MSKPDAELGGVVGVVGVDAIGVAASDLDRSIAFYRRLGVRGLPEAGGDAAHVEGELTGGMRLMLDSEELLRSITPSWAPHGPGRVTLAVGCTTAAAVDALYAELAADGYCHREPWDAPWGQRYASVVDPDGLPVDLYTPLAPP